jgi:hypothetical protein
LSRRALPSEKYRTGRDVAKFFEKATDSVLSLPGVASAAAINLLPVADWGFNGNVNVEGLPPHAQEFFRPPAGVPREHQTRHIRARHQVQNQHRNLQHHKSIANASRTPASRLQSCSRRIDVPWPASLSERQHCCRGEPRRSRKSTDRLAKIVKD